MYIIKPRPKNNFIIVTGIFVTRQLIVTKDL
jgi:hypothetical protein